MSLVKDLQGFSTADLSPYPPLSTLGDPRSQALWVLWVGRDSIGTPQMTPGEISAVLRDGFGIHVSRQKIEGFLSQERQVVAKRKKQGRRAYQIMQAGIDEVYSRGPGTIFVDPTQALSGIRETQGILADLQGDLSVCDPYVDGRTLDFLADCKAATSIRLLTYNIKKPPAFERDVKAFNREHDSSLEVRVATAKVLHDRYIIHEGGMLLLGTSLNGLGMKQSFVVNIGQDLRSTTLQAFDALWNEGSAPM